MGGEQRRFIRITSRLTAIVKIVKTGKIKRALTRDVSAGGICVVTEEILEPGTALEVELKLPDREAPVRFLGEVAWSRPIGPTPKSYENPTEETGVKFISIDPNDRTLLMQYAKLNAPPKS
ncbi:MAG: PilZ domain-containing protein [Candidatus Omnitrophica bacterium]|nr:PilZ domain-containing protein [Candidatus Omnitrophota bacterium]